MIYWHIAPFAAANQERQRGSPQVAPTAVWFDRANSRYWMCCGRAVSWPMSPIGREWPECMVRPCVARGFRRSGGRAVLHQCIRLL